MAECRCGCGEFLKGKRVFVNKEHQLAWMVGGGARQLNALQPTEGKQKGGATAGRTAAESRRLIEASIKGGARSREIAEQFRNARVLGQ